MAVPRKRHTHSRTRKRRSHDALSAPSFITCPQCREPMTLHHVCPSCGYYRSRQVIEKI